MGRDFTAAKDFSSFSIFAEVGNSEITWFQKPN